MATSHLPPPLTLANGRPLHEQGQIDGLAIPHVFSFAQIIGGASQTYWHDRFDEAMRHARENALAMRRDCYLMGLLGERKRAVASLPWYLEVPDPRDPVQAAVRAQLTQSLRGVRGFSRMIWQWLEAIWYGRSGVQFEWCWQEIQGRRALGVKQWSPLQGDKIGYHWDSVPYVLVNAARASQLPTAELVNTTVARSLRLSGGWRERFIIHQHEIEDSDFFEGEAGDARHGVGIRSRIYWLDYLKREYLDWVVTYLERVGLGTTLWKYDASDPEGKTKAEEAAKENSRRTNITVPIWPDSRGGMVGGIERIEAPTGGVEVLRSMIDALDAYIERYVVGQAGSSRGSSAGLGNEAAHEFMSNTKDAIRDQDAHLLAETITGCDSDPGMISLMQRYTFPETTPDRPNGFPVLFKFGLERSLNNQRVQTILMLLDKGLPVRKDDLYNAAGISRPEPHDDVILPLMAMPPAPGDGPPGGGGGGPDKGRPDDKGGKPKPGGDKGKPQHNAAEGRGERLDYAEDEGEEEPQGVWRPGGGRYVYGREDKPVLHSLPRRGGDYDDETGDIPVGPKEKGPRSRWGSNLHGSARDSYDESDGTGSSDLRKSAFSGTPGSLASADALAEGEDEFFDQQDDVPAEDDDDDAEQYFRDPLAYAEGDEETEEPEPEDDDVAETLNRVRQIRSLRDAYGDDWWGHGEDGKTFGTEEGPGGGGTYSGQPNVYAADEPDPDDLLSDEEFVPDPEPEEELRAPATKPARRRQWQAPLQGSEFDSDAEGNDQGVSDIYKAVHGPGGSVAGRQGAIGEFIERNHDEGDSRLVEDSQYARQKPKPKRRR